MRVIFECHTIYQVFISYIITKTEYRDDKYEVILILEDNTKHLKENAEKIKVWDEIFIVPSRASEEKILNIFKENNLLEVDILHIFAFGSLVGNLLSNNVNNTTKVISTEEGFTVYSWQENFEKWNRDLRWFDEKNILDCSKIKEGIFFDSRVVDDSLPIIKKDINIEKFIEILRMDKAKELNTLFGYTHHHEKRNNVFFDTYLNKINIIGDDYQKFLISEIADCFSKTNVLFFKKHPSELSSLKFGQDNIKDKGIENIKYIDESIVPWEIIFLNEVFCDNNFDDRLYISYNSTAVFNCMIFGNKLGVNVKLICIGGCINIFDNKRFSLNKKIMERYKILYSNNNIYLCDNIVNVKEVINKELDKKYKNSINERLCIKDRELSWLRQYYIKNYDSLIRNKKYLYSKIIINNDYFNNDDLNAEYTLEAKRGVNIITLAFNNKILCNNIRWIYCENNYKVKIKIKKICINNKIYNGDMQLNEDYVDILFQNKKEIEKIYFEFDIKDIKELNRSFERTQINTRFLKQWFEYNEFGDGICKINKYKNIYLFGASEYSELLLRYLEKRKILVNGIIDSNYPENNFKGYKVVKPKYLNTLNDIENVIVTMPARFNSVYDGIKHIRNDIIIINIKDIFK